jgi:hypothetical protein
MIIIYIALGIVFGWLGIKALKKAKGSLDDYSPEPRRKTWNELELEDILSPYTVRQLYGDMIPKDDLDKMMPKIKELAEKEMRVAEGEKRKEKNESNAWAFAVVALIALGAWLGWMA